MTLVPIVILFPILFFTVMVAIIVIASITAIGMHGVIEQGGEMSVFSGIGQRMEWEGH